MLDVFPLFSRLPPEIRIAIFSFIHLHQPPRIIEASLRPFHLVKSYAAYIRPTPENRPISTEGWHTVTPSARYLPPTLHICKEARSEALQIYHWLSLGCWFNYHSDVLYFGEEALYIDIDDFLSHDSKEADVRRLRFLALIGGDYFAERTRVGRLREMENLREVTIVSGNDEEYLQPGRARIGYDIGFVLESGSVSDPDEFVDWANRVQRILKELEGLHSEEYKDEEEQRAELVVQQMDVRRLVRI